MRPTGLRGRLSRLLASGTIRRRLGAWRREEIDYPGLVGGPVVYAIGDIHGRSDLLEALYRAIDADVARRRTAHVEIHLGDYVDRGADSRGVLDLVVARILHRPPERRVVVLRGNHEVLFQEMLAGDLDPEHWRRAGGFQTAASYGVDVGSLVGADAAHWGAALRAAVPPMHRIFLGGLRDSHAIGDYFFAHAGIRPGVPLEEQRREDLCWIRDEFLGDDRDHGKIVVHGHTPTGRPDFRRNRIGVDTGAYLTNRLTCLVVDATGPSVLASPEPIGPLPIDPE